MVNMLVGIISVLYFSIFQHCGIFIFLSRYFTICTFLVNICLILFFFLFLISSFLHFSPLITEEIFLKEIKQTSEKKFLTILSKFSFGSVWTSHVSPVELHKTELHNHSQLQLYKYRQWKFLSADQLSSITIGIIGLTINNSDW